MIDYFEPDDRWPIFGVTTKNDYLAKYLIRWHFHANVPKDIQEAFETVEYLLAHAWYHYPLYDEGMNKALRIMEMAVRLKAIATGIDTKTKERKDRPLFQLIKEITKGDHFTELRQQLDRFREMRNLQMHPKHHGFMGGTNRQPANIKLVVNLINRMFMEEDWHVQVHQHTEAMERLLKTWECHPLITGSGKPLLRRIIAFQVYGPWLHLVAEPILLHPAEPITKHQVVAPIQFRIQNFENTPAGISGKDENNGIISVSCSSDRSNLMTYKDNLDKIASLPENDVGIFEIVLKSDAPWFLVEGEYNYWAQKRHLG
jgi:hypothetical protein